VSVTQGLGLNPPGGGGGGPGGTTVVDKVTVTVRPDDATVREKSDVVRVTVK